MGRCPHRGLAPLPTSCAAPPLRHSANARETPRRETSAIAREKAAEACWRETAARNAKHQQERAEKRRRRREATAARLADAAADERGMAHSDQIWKGGARRVSRWVEVLSDGRDGGSRKPPKHEIYVSRRRVADAARPDHTHLRARARPINNRISTLLETWRHGARRALVQSAREAAAAASTTTTTCRYTNMILYYTTATTT